LTVPFPIRPLTMVHRIAAVALVALLGSACATRHAITGVVVDRNGDPMDRVIVALDPGNVEILTDNEGQFSIDYVRKEGGDRARLPRRSDYTLTFFRTGFQDGREDIQYKRGAYDCGNIRMVEDTITVAPPAAPLDPDKLHSAPAASGGATYEGE